MTTALSVTPALRPSLDRVGIVPDAVELVEGVVDPWARGVILDAGDRPGPPGFTILRLPERDDARPTYFHGGRFGQRSQSGGRVISESIA
jgi:hypothetical protein